MAPHDGLFTGGGPSFELWTPAAHAPGLTDAFIGRLSVRRCPFQHARRRGVAAGCGADPARRLSLERRQNGQQRRAAADPGSQGRQHLRRGARAKLMQVGRAAVQALPVLDVML
jgi:hypothetical protein